MNDRDVSLDPDDQVLVAELRDALEATDPVPPWLLSAARETFTWRTIDAELAELTYDSLTDEALLAGVRGELQQRMLTFTAPGVTVEIEVSNDGGERRLLGQVVPPAAGDVDVAYPDGSTHALVDDVGRFIVADVPAGPVRLRCSLADDRAVEMPWLIL